MGPPKLIESDAVLAAMFHASGDVIMIVDAEGRIVLVNEAAERVLGYTAAELEGRGVECLVPKSFHGHARQRQSYEAKPVARPMGRGILQAVRADGAEIPVDIALTPLVIDGQRYTMTVLRDMRGRIDMPEVVRVQATALRSAANGIVITDRRGTIVWVNHAACAITGYEAHELVGNHTRILKSGEHDEAFYAKLWRTISAGDSWSGTIVNRRKDGARYDEEQTIAPVVGEDGEITHFIAIKQDITERRRSEEALVAANRQLAAYVTEIELLNTRLAEQTIRDPLTGLHNRRFFEEVAQREFERAARHGDALSVVMIDIDHFKRVNDTFGHEAGDEVLRSFARILRAHARAEDLICRYGGEEFVCILGGAAMDAARERAEEWRRLVEDAEISVAGQGSIRCTISAGVAQADASRDTVASAVRRADAALYRAKSEGRNRICADLRSAAPVP